MIMKDPVTKAQSAALTVFNVKTWLGWKKYASKLECFDSKDSGKRLKCCCTSRVPDLFVLAHKFRDFAHVHARNLHAHAQNLRVHVWNSVHTCTWNPNAIYHTENPSQNSENCIGWPWPLTYDLDLQTHPRYYQGQSLYQISWSTSNSSALRALTDRHTDTHTEMAPFL